MPSESVAILDENGNTVVSYGYNAWGAPLWCTGELAETLGTVQPFRYRGYVFDEETGLYYLRSRYYSAERCRFVNADSVLLNGLLVCNQQAYCCNNPVLYSDSNGRDIFEDIWNLFCDAVKNNQEIVMLVEENQRIAKQNSDADYEARKIILFWIDGVAENIMQAWNLATWAVSGVNIVAVNVAVEGVIAVTSGVLCTVAWGINGLFMYADFMTNMWRNAEQ